MITFVLPIGSELDYKYAFEILLPSFFYHQKLEDYKFIIIYKANHKYLLDQYYLNDEYNYDKFDFLDEESICTDGIPEVTYYFQMYLKLKIAELVETSHYITLDSDIFFSKPFSESNFIEGDKCYCYIVKKVDAWIKRVMVYLKIKVDYAINQTPFVFKTALVEQMLNDIDVEDLIINKNCNEYGLFFGWLLRKHIFKKNYKHKQFRSVGLHHKLVSGKSIEELKKIFHETAKNSFIVVVQSRTLIHYKLENEFKTYVPTCQFKIPKIAMMTIIGGMDYFNRYKLSIDIKKLYCKKNYYDFVFSYKGQKVNGWAKINGLLKIMKEGKYDYIFVSDADVTITNFDHRIENIINKYKDGKDYMCYLSTDNNSINSGNVIWRCCDESILFLNKMLELKDDKIRYTIRKPFFPKGIYEQPSLIYLYNKYENWRELIKIIPQFEINSYTNILVKDSNVVEVIDGVINRVQWKEGDFLVHYAGVNYQKWFDNDNADKKINAIINLYQKKWISKKEGKDFGKIK